MISAFLLPILVLVIISYLLKKLELKRWFYMIKVCSAILITYLTISNQHFNLLAYSWVILISSQFIYHYLIGIVRKLT
jgi:hypothetical protein